MPTPLPGWSAAALTSNPREIEAIHADYAAAGATVHTAVTFRTKRRTFPEDWERLTHLAVRLAKRNVPAEHRVAGSLAPLEDCYRPELSPADPRPEHREMARALAAAGADLIICETFPHVGESLVAVEEAVATELETWLSLTPGPYADLLSPAEVQAGAQDALARGAQAVLVNCVAATKAQPYVEALVALEVPCGIYANAGHPDEKIGWKPTAFGPARYAALAERWAEAGATIVGSCCGTGPEHIAEVARRLG